MVCQKDDLPAIFVYRMAYSCMQIFVDNVCMCFVFQVLDCPIKMIWKLCRLRSSLCLQFKPQHIAAGAAFLAAKFLNVDLSSNQTMWQEFETTPTILQGEECFLKILSWYFNFTSYKFETGHVCSLHNSWYDFAFIEDFMYMFMKLVLYLNHWFDLLIEFALRRIFFVHTWMS